VSLPGWQAAQLASGSLAAKILPYVSHVVDDLGANDILLAPPNADANSILLQLLNNKRQIWQAYNSNPYKNIPLSNIATTTLMGTTTTSGGVPWMDAATQIVLGNADAFRAYNSAARAGIRYNANDPNSPVIKCFDLARKVEHNPDASPETLKWASNGTPYWLTAEGAHFTSTGSRLASQAVDLNWFLSPGP